MRYARTKELGIIWVGDWLRLDEPRPVPTCPGRDPFYEQCTATVTLCAERSEKVDTYFAVRLKDTQHIKGCNQGRHIDPDNLNPEGPSSLADSGQDAHRGELVLDLLAPPQTQPTRSAAQDHTTARRAHARQTGQARTPAKSRSHSPRHQAAPLSIIADLIQADALPPDRTVKLGRRTCRIEDVLRGPDHTITPTDIDSGSWVILYAPVRNVRRGKDEALFINISAYGQRPSLAVLLPHGASLAAYQTAQELVSRRTAGWHVLALGYLRTTRNRDVLLHPYRRAHQSSPPVLLLEPPTASPDRSG